LTLPKCYKPSGSLPVRRSHKKAWMVVVVFIFIIVNMAVFWNHFNRQVIVQHNWEMLEEDCFPVYATWDPVKTDYDKLTTQWDCTSDILRYTK